MGAYKERYSPDRILGVVKRLSHNYGTIKSLFKLQTEFDAAAVSFWQPFLGTRSCKIPMPVSVKLVAYAKSCGVTMKHEVMESAVTFSVAYFSPRTHHHIEMVRCHCTFRLPSNTELHIATLSLLSKLNMNQRQAVTSKLCVLQIYVQKFVQRFGFQENLFKVLYLKFYCLVSDRLTSTKYLSQQKYPRFKNRCEGVTRIGKDNWSRSFTYVRDKSATSPGNRRAVFLELRVEILPPHLPRLIS